MKIDSLAIGKVVCISNSTVSNKYGLPVSNLNKNVENQPTILSEFENKQIVNKN